MPRERIRKDIVYRFEELSEEGIIETINGNEYEFTENGKLT